jgi:hypothetical protein
MKPHSAEGLCAQRWYDLSFEALYLTHSNGSLAGDVTSLGVAPAGPIVLRLGDSDGGDDGEEGMRLSAAFIFGAGGNIEATYMGGNQWRNQAVATDNPGGGLFSFVSDFGTNPGGPPGYDDTDRSIAQSVATESEFHSGELNYRRRTVGPYCRFQSSCLFGLRYIRYEDGLLYSTLGDATRFFSSSDSLKNNMFGPQAGFDVWWNVCAGFRLGIGMKGAWVRNEIDRRTALTANSLASGVVIDDKQHDTTLMAEIEGKFIYRFSHSWAVRGAYYVITIDEVAFGTADRETIRDFVTANPVSDPGFHLNSLTVQGASLGAEYRW